jgi:hypothetical protein
MGSSVCMSKSLYFKEELPQFTTRIFISNIASLSSHNKTLYNPNHPRKVFLPKG